MKPTPPGLLDRIAVAQNDHIRGVSRAELKQRGQVFTPPEVARFMASLHGPFPKDIRILDPGAGMGILTAAICDRIRSLKSSRRVSITAFETDPSLQSPLEKNLETCREVLSKAGHQMTYAVRQEDFIAVAAPKSSGRSLLDDSDLRDDFTTVVMNPPYFKLRKDSPQAKHLASIIHGQPNAYAFFLAIGTSLLRDGGELIAITPRRFCGGLYFRAFRRWLLSRLSLEHVHLFESRTDVFKEAEVLQESVITRFRAAPKEAGRIRISASHGKDVGRETESIECDMAEVLDTSDEHWTIRIPVSEEDRHVLETIERLPLKFCETGLRISTGPVVAFRVREFLVGEANGQGTVPLLWPHNVKPYSVRWPEGKRSKPEAIICDAASRKLLVPSRNYVVLKRLSSKEERRRVTAGCLLGDCLDGAWLGLENHLNYVYHAERELTENEVFGIAAVFNSSLIDRYFRIISGNTQINATEIRSLPFPSLSLLEEIGAGVQAMAAIGAEMDDQIDTIVANVFGFSDLVSGGVPA